MATATQAANNAQPTGTRNAANQPVQTAPAPVQSAPAPTVYTYTGRSAATDGTYAALAITLGKLYTRNAQGTIVRAFGNVGACATGVQVVPAYNVPACVLVGASGGALAPTTYKKALAALKGLCNAQGAPVWGQVQAGTVAGTVACSN